MSPSTLAPQYDPTATERGTYARWMAAGLFQPRGDGEPYVIVIPPPNVTDILHMGHGLNNTIQDVLIRSQRMRGRATLWLPGTDHAAIATHNVIERQLAQEGKSRFDIGREAFLARVERYQREKGGVILEQLKALGASCDWSRTRFTLDEPYSRAVRRVFVTLYREGLIYRGHRVIHWCPRCLTALSDEEAEFHEAEGELYYIRYPVVDFPAGEKAPNAKRTRSTRSGNRGAALPRFIVVATTRPETMLGDVAVAVHPDARKTAWALGQRVQLPLTNIALAIVPDAAVDPEFGTGFVKVTPAHDATDFEIGQRFTLPMPLVMDADGRMRDPGDPVGRRVPEALEGLDRFAAREKVVELLRAQGLLEKIEPHRHAVRRCYRCGTVVEPRLSDQWFVRMKPLADRALEEYRAGRLQFIPERWGAVYEHWLSDIRDWNISRQIWFGHRVPAWYCDACGDIIVSETTPTACPACGGVLRADEDVLDTWFSSGLWPFATLGWPQRTADLARFYPGHTLVTAPDIIFFWVARMVMLGYHFMGERPFDTVVLNGIVRDAQHRKMSKSAGNGIDPLEVIQRFGADALRFTLIASAPIGTDIMLDHEDLDASFAPGRNFANKLWNAVRLILSPAPSPPAGTSGAAASSGDAARASAAHASDAAMPSAELPPAWSPPAGAAGAGMDAPVAPLPSELELADRWILSRTQHAIAAVTDALDRYRLNDAAGAAYHFVWNELADWYLEQVKPRLYGQAPGVATARAVLGHVVDVALRLLHPVMPFITEELWSHLPGQREPLLAGAAWPTVDERRVDPDAEQRFAAVQALVTAVRSVRAEYGVHPSHAIRVHVTPGSPAASAAFAAERGTIERLARVGQLALDGDGAEGAGAHAVLPDGSGVFIALADAIDVQKECERLGRDLLRLEKQLSALEGKLANQDFLTRAPGDVVERERAKQQSWREQRDTLADKLRALGC